MNLIRSFYLSLLVVSLGCTAETGTPIEIPVFPDTTIVASTEPSFNSQTDRLLHSDDFSLLDAIQKYTLMDGERGLSIDSSRLRIDWLSKDNCQDDGHLIETSWMGAPREIFVQLNLQYEQNFIWDWLGRTPCTGNAKKMLFLWGGTSGRFMMITENHTIGLGSDQDHPLFQQNIGSTITPEQLGDGKLHKITLHVIQSSTPTSNDGLVEGWIDGVKKWSYTNVASHASGGWTTTKYGTTFNQGSPINQREWLDSWRIWTK